MLFRHSIRGLKVAARTPSRIFLLQNLESVVPLAATFALRALMSMLLHWEMESGHRPANAKGKDKSEPPKDGENG